MTEDTERFVAEGYTLTPELGGWVKATRTVCKCGEDVMTLDTIRSDIPQDVCQICLSKGILQKHHIISRAIIKKIKTGEHGYDLGLEYSGRNLITLCVPCHELTGSHFYRRWIRSQERKGEPIEDPKERRRRRARNANRQRLEREERWASGECFRCSGMNKGGRSRCSKTVKKEGGFCGTHLWQAPKPEE